MTRPVAVGDYVTWKSEVDFGWGAAVWRVLEIKGYRDRPNVAVLDHQRRAQTNHYSVDLLRPLTARERTAAGIVDRGTTSSSPSRSYLVGLPVTITVHDDGTVTATVHTEDIVEAVSDYDDDNAPDGATILADAATAGQTMTLTDYTIRID